MSRPWQHVATENDLFFWIKWLDDLGDERIARIDREECRSAEEVEHFGLSSIPRVEQARILRALEENLQPRKAPDRHAPGPYALKHDAESYIRLSEDRRGYYVSELQARTCMRIMGYKHTCCEPYRYNVTLTSYHRWRRRIAELRRCR